MHTSGDPVTMVMPGLPGLMRNKPTSEIPLVLAVRKKDMGMIGKLTYLLPTEFKYTLAELAEAISAVPKEVANNEKEVIAEIKNALNAYIRQCFPKTQLAPPGGQVELQDISSSGSNQRNAGLPPSVQKTVSETPQ